MKIIIGNKYNISGEVDNEYVDYDVEVIDDNGTLALQDIKVKKCII